MLGASYDGVKHLEPTGEPVLHTVKFNNELQYAKCYNDDFELAHRRYGLADAPPKWNGTLEVKEYVQDARTMYVFEMNGIKFQHTNPPPSHKDMKTSSTYMKHLNPDDLFDDEDNWSITEYTKDFNTVFLKRRWNGFQFLFERIYE